MRSWLARLLVALHLRPAPRRRVEWLPELTAAQRDAWRRPEELPRRWLDGGPRWRW